MSFVLRMAARELRASSRRLFFFFVSIAVGVGAMIALGSVIQSVRAALLKESKSITAADVLIWADRPYSDNAQFLIDEKLEKHGAREITRSVESTAMARPELGGGRGDDDGRASRRGAGVSLLREDGARGWSSLFARSAEGAWRAR